MHAEYSSSRYSDCVAGSEVDIRITLAENLVIRAEALVVRMISGGAGIEFRGVDAEGFEHLKNLVRLNADDPELVDREFEEHRGLTRR